jgi:hypothetical protein
VLDKDKQIATPPREGKGFAFWKLETTIRITTPNFIHLWRIKFTPPMEGNFFNFYPPSADEITPLPSPLATSEIFLPERKESPAKAGGEFLSDFEK